MQLIIIDTKTGWRVSEGIKAVIKSGYKISTNSTQVIMETSDESIVSWVTEYYNATAYTINSHGNKGSVPWLLLD